MQQRYFDHVIGRFYLDDPVGFAASDPMMFNRYAYANNNPYKYTDPNGGENKPCSSSENGFATMTDPCDGQLFAEIFIAGSMRCAIGAILIMISFITILFVNMLKGSPEEK